MASAQFINRHGKQILLMDFSDVRSAAGISQKADEIKKIVAQQEPKSLLGLVDFRGMLNSRESNKIIKGMAAHNRPYMKFIALVGLGFPRSFAFRVMLRLTGRNNHKVFAKREKALDWLGGK